jgi:cysteine synthase B
MGTTARSWVRRKFLKEKNPKIQVIGVHPAEGAQVPGIRKWPEAYQTEDLRPLARRIASSR